MIATSNDTWKVRLFGPLEVTSPTAQRFVLGSRKAAELLAFLSLRRNSVVNRDAAAEALWPEGDPESGRNRLKQTIAVLRKEVEGFPLTVLGKNEIELPRDLVSVDYHAVEGRLKWFKSMPEPHRSEAARQVWELTKEGFLPGIEAPWVLPERARFRVLEAELQRELQDAPMVAAPRFQFGDVFGKRTTPLAGRESEVEAIRKWMADARARALHLVGPPGVGKTRLIEEVIEQSRDLYDAVVFLSTVQSSETPWLERLGQALGLSDPQLVTHALVQLLRGFRRPILALDDVDQASEEMRDWISEVLRATPVLKVLASARTVVTGRGQEVLHVSPLHPEEGFALLASFAGHLGVPETALKVQEPALREITSYLDGLPLALEVAASWLPYLQPDSLLDRLKSTPGLLVDRAATGHDSISACIQTLTQGLSGAEKRALLALCVCKGGCGSDLANELIGSDWPYLLRTLVERSLAIHSSGFSGPRFFVLQAIRDSIRLLEANDTEQALIHHSAAVMRVAETACFEINEGNRSRWLNWLKDEADNVVQACQTGTQHPELLDQTLGLMDSLLHPMWVIGRSRDWHKIRREACNAAKGRNLSLGAELTLIGYKKDLAFREENWEAATEAASKFVGRVEEAGGGDFLLAKAHRMLAECLGHTDVGRSAGHYRISTEGYLRAGYPRHALWNQAELIRAAHRLGNHEEALTLRAETFELAKQLGDENSVGMYLKEFAAESLSSGDYARAKELAEQAVERFEGLAESLNQANAMIMLAAAEVCLGSRDQAEETIAKAAALIPADDKVRQDKLSHLRGAIASKSIKEMRFDFLLNY